MATTNVKAGGAWRPVKQLWVKSGGAWRNIRQAWTKSGGVWREIFTIFNPAVSHTQVYSGAGISYINFNTTGTVQTGTTGGFVENWYTPTTTGIGNSHWVRFTHVSGTAPGYGSAVNTWHALTAARDCGYFAFSPEDVTGTILCEISTNSGGTNIIRAVYFTYHCQPAA